MKILLVNPPRSPHNDILAFAPAEAKRFIHRKLIGPPLGLLTVAAAVRDHDVALLEMKGEYDLRPDAPPPAALLSEWMTRHHPDIVAVTVIASEFPAGLEIMRTAKRIDPAVTTVAGGLHATLCPNDFDDAAVDAVCPGQSAAAFRELVRAKERGASLLSVAGIGVRVDGRLRWTAPGTGGPDPAGGGFIMPDRSLISRWISTYVVGRAPGPVTYLFTSLGCPHRCTFCSIWPAFGGRFHQRTAASIVEELKTLDDYPVVRFADANTAVDERFIDELVAAIEAAGIRKEYVMDMRADTAAAKPRLVEKLARIGLKVVICGFESFRSEDLRRYNKNAEAAEIARAVEVFHRNGISVRGNYVIPPDYGPDDFAALAEFAAPNAVNFAGYTILTPMPGTSLHADMREQIVDRDLARYNFFNCVLKTRMPARDFMESVGRLWLIRRGEQVI